MALLGEGVVTELGCVMCASIEGKWKVPCVL